MFLRICYRSFPISLAVLIGMLLLLNSICFRFDLHCYPFVVKIFDAANLGSRDERLNRYLIDNVKRLSQAKRFLETGNPKFDDDPVLVIGVVTIKRNYPEEKQLNYLTQVVGRLVELLSIAKNRGRDMRATVAVCSMDSNATGFTEVGYLTRFVSVIWKSSFVPTVSLAENVFERERADYEFCLRFLAERYANAKFILILEDDALPSDSFIYDISDVLTQLNRSVSSYERAHNRVGYVKLYHPYRLRKLPFLVHIFAISVAISYLVLLLLQYLVALSTRLVHWPINNIRLLVIYCCIFGHFLVFFYLLGPEALSRIRYSVTGGSMYLIASESCCTPAMLFPMETVSDTIKFLGSHGAKTNYAKDHILDEMPGSIGVRALMTDLNLVRHIGMYTTLRKKEINIDIVD